MIGEESVLKKVGSQIRERIGNNCEGLQARQKNGNMLKEVRALKD